MADELLHYVIPVLFMAYWWVVLPRAAVHWGHIPRWMIYPVVYFLYHTIRGAVSGVYPYPFIDPSKRRSVAAVPHRQVVFTIPKRLRTWCLYRRALLGDLARVAARTV